MSATIERQSVGNPQLRRLARNLRTGDDSVAEWLAAIAFTVAAAAACGYALLKAMP